MATLNTTKPNQETEAGTAKQALIIGSGIAGMTCAITLAEQGVRAILVSSFPSERAQSVMAAGGINGVLTDAETQEGTGAIEATNELGDSIACHIEDTLKGGCHLAGRRAVTNLCTAAPDIIRWLEKLGMVFTRDEEGHIDRRAFGGQTFRRTCYSGSATGKQIVSTLVMETRRFESMGLIERRLWTDFHSALIEGDTCYGALLYNEQTRSLEPCYADALIVATGGQNALFGKTTGSTQCDGYTAGKLFLQGVELKNLEFIQYHPTTMETAQKRMLLSEAARGEGGRLFYEQDGNRVYFMEEKYGEKGNLMPRDIVAREMYAAPSQVYLDVSFLGEALIDRKLSEVRELALKYRGIDIAKEPVPVDPSVHFFMGGIAVDEHHETNIHRLYAIGECASRYHGANRLGGNSLLAAIHSGNVAARAVAEINSFGDKREPEEGAGEEQKARPDFADYISEQNDILAKGMASASKFPVVYLKDEVAKVMQQRMGILRDEASLEQGIEDVEYYRHVATKLHYDSSVLPYFNYSVDGILALAQAVLICAKFRKESRGAHTRTDYPETREDCQKATIIAYEDGAFRVRLDEEGRYED